MNWKVETNFSFLGEQWTERKNVGIATEAEKSACYDNSLR